MRNIITLFLKKTSGSIAVMGAVTIGVVAMMTSFAIDYSKSINSKITIQRAADAATLVAASTFRDDEDKDKAAALKRANAYFDNAVERIEGVRIVRSFDVDETSDDGEIAANGTVDIVFDSLFGSGSFENVMKSRIDALAVIKHTPQDLYLVLLVDSTSSMNRLIDSVRDAAHDLETDVREKLLAKGLEFNHLYVKVAFFGDMRTDIAPYGWRESPLYDLSLEADIDDFRHFVASTPTYYGGDLPESGPAAIAHFLTAPLPAPLKRVKTVQSFVIWTDAAGLPFSDDSYQADVTVNLYNRLGNLGEGTRWYSDYTHRADRGWINTRLSRYYYDEDAEYDGDATGSEAVPPTYGCCSTFEVFEDRWRSKGTVPLSRRTLGLIVPFALGPWKTMASWPNVSIRNYETPSASGIIDDVVNSLNDSYSPLALSR